MGRKPGSDPTTLLCSVVTVLWEMVWQTLELLGYVSGVLSRTLLN
jgi:hypothetical protein